MNGSTRMNNNADGVTSWVQSRFSLLTQGISISPPIIIDLKGGTPPLPLGPITSPIAPLALPYIPGHKTNLDGTITWPYIDPRESQWSEIVQRLDGLVIVTPEYNKCIPGEVKNTIDHLYPEWEGLPIAVINFGGQGGDGCSQQMEVLLQAIKAKVVSAREISIVLPFGDYIAGMRRTKPEDELFKEYEGKLDGVVGRMVEAAAKRSVWNEERKKMAEMGKELHQTLGG